MSTVAEKLAKKSTSKSSAKQVRLRLVYIDFWSAVKLSSSTLTDAGVRAEIAAAGAHYAERNAAFTARLHAHGLDAPASDGLSLWLPLPLPAQVVVERLMRRGWLARTGDEFALHERAAPSHHLRLTVHDLSDEDAALLVSDLVAAVR